MLTVKPYQFVIDRQSESKGGHAERIRDTDDGREAMRNRLFVRWFTEKVDPTRYTIKTAHCQVEDQVFYTAIILQKTHPYYAEVTTEFDALAENYSQKPE